MRRRLLSLLLPLLVLALAGCSRSPEAGNEAWFPLAAGHRWTYRVTTEIGRAHV